MASVSSVIVWCDFQLRDPNRAAHICVINMVIQ